MIGALATVFEGIGITLFLPILTSSQGFPPEGLPRVMQRLFPARERGLLPVILLIFGFLILKNVLVYSNRTLLGWIEGKTGHDFAAGCSTS